MGHAEGVLLMSEALGWFQAVAADFGALLGFQLPPAVLGAVLGLCGLLGALGVGLWWGRRSLGRSALLRSKKDQERFDVRGVVYQPRLFRWRQRRGR